MKLAYSIKETAELTGIGVTKLYECISTRKLRASKFGRKTLILKQDLQAFLEGLEPFVKEVSDAE